MSKLPPESRSSQVHPIEQQSRQHQQLLGAVSHLEQVIEMQLSLLKAIRQHLVQQPTLSTSAAHTLTPESPT